MSLKFPIMFINFKTYEESTGDNAISLAVSAEEVSKEKNIDIAVVVQPTDIKSVSEKTGLTVFAQHIDPIVFGSNTGHILPEAVKKAGASGTILNHAENKLDNVVLEKTIIRAKEVGLSVMVCAESIERAKEIASFNSKPDLIAIEPPELIGGTVSVSTANPELIENTVKEISSIAEIPIITGAGIKDSNDVKIALKLGTHGVFVASGIIKAPNQKQAIEELISGFE